MRRTLIALVLFAAPAQATAQSRADARNVTPAPAPANVPPPPSSWTGSEAAWRAHAARCAARYRSYNPRIDAYVGLRGDRVRCRL